MQQQGLRNQDRRRDMHKRQHNTINLWVQTREQVARHFIASNRFLPYAGSALCILELADHAPRSMHVAAARASKIRKSPRCWLIASGCARQLAALHEMFGRLLADRQPLFEYA